MKKNGFTLIELLGVIIILALLMTLALPKIINSVKSSSTKTDELTKKLIYNATELFISDHENLFNEASEFCVSLEELTNGGYLQAPVKLSDSDDDLTHSKSIKVRYNSESRYELMDNSSCFKQYLLGEEIELTGNTYTITGSGSEGNFIYTTENFSKWNVIKQTDTTVTLLSRLPLGNIYTSEGKNLNGFVNDITEIALCTACTLGNTNTYTYNGITSKVPTTDDLNEIIIINSDRYDFKNYYEGFNTGMYPTLDAGKVYYNDDINTFGMKILDNGTVKILREYNGTGYITIPSDSTFPYFNRQVITLPKTLIFNY